MFESLADLYRRSEVLKPDGFAPALADSCRNRAACWAGCGDRRGRSARVHGQNGEDGSIFFPWVGADYRPGGVCVVGWNINHGGEDWFPLTEEHVIATASRAKLAKGDYTVWGSMFAYRSMSAAAAVNDALGGAEPVEKPRPQDLFAYFARVARIQAVKCAPLENRSNPTSEMNRLCPPAFLAEELAILKPRALIVFGEAAKEGVLSVLREMDPHPHWSTKTTDGCGRRESNTPWGPLDLFSMWHPSYARWQTAQRSLISSLVANPLTSAGGARG